MGPRGLKAHGSLKCDSPIPEQIAAIFRNGYYSEADGRGDCVFAHFPA